MRDPSVLAVEAEVRATHWWFLGRRRLLARILAGLAVPRSARILDLGTGSGNNLELMRDLGFTRRVGLDASPEAVYFCESSGFGPVQLGDMLDLPFVAGSFELVLATDVVEHADDDAQALREISRVLTPGGYAILTVPAFRSLWGRQDEIAHHRRRYRLGPFVALVEAMGLQVVRKHYFNYLLFAPIWAARRAMRWFGLNVENENLVNTPLLNRVLTSIFDFDVRTASMLRPPFGVSILVVAQKKAGRA